MKRIIYLLLMLMPALALAQTAGSGPFTPGTDDVSVKVLNQLFGTLVNGGNDAFGSAISTFNSAVLIVGGILAAYTILAGTIGTAHDGEMLGKKFSSVWIPIRYSLGTAVVLPVLPNGYCIMQQIVMWLCLQGVGLGGQIWSSYMQTPGVAANISINGLAQEKADKLAYNIFRASLCVAANNNFAQTGSDQVLGLKSEHNYGTSFDSSKNAWYFGDQTPGVFNSNSSCGQVKLADPIPNSTVASGPATTNNGYLGPLDNLFAPTDVSSINTAHLTATNALIASMTALATQAANQDPNAMNQTIAANYLNQINTASAAYMKSVQAVAQGVANSPSDSTKKAQQYGWFMAGAYFMNTVVTNNKITNAMNAVPDSSFTTDSFSESVNNVMTSIGSKVADVKKEWNDLGPGMIVNWLASGFTKINLYELKNDPRHPIIIINEMGDRLQTIWDVMIITIFGLVLASVLAKLTPITNLLAKVALDGGTVTNILLTLIGFLGLPIMALAMTSFTAKYVIPMLPFMMWLGVIGGWLIAVVIAMLMAPMWAIMHLHPNGDDLTGRGGNGYMLVLGLLLRPALAIFGFIAAISISSVMGEFINKVFFQVFSFSAGDGNGTSFFIGMIAACAIYVGIMFAFIKKCFSLIHVIPDEAMKWIGGGSDNLGHYAGKMGEGAQGGVSQVASFMAGRGISQGLQNTKQQIGGAASAAKEKKLADKSDKVGSANKFAETKSAWDDQFGMGAGDRVASIFGLNEDTFSSKNPESLEMQSKIAKFNHGAKMANAYGGEEGKQEYLNRMESASRRDFDAEGGFDAAAEYHGKSVATKSLKNEAEERFGEGASKYYTALALSEDPTLLDFKAAGAAKADLKLAKRALGENFQPVLQEALTKGSGEEMRSFLREKTAEAAQNNQHAKTVEVKQNDRTENGEK